MLRTLRASEANLEKGEMRIEANISVAPKHQEPSTKHQASIKSQMGTKVEIKNLNSFRSVERAIAFEIERQTAHLAQGGTLTQETRGWDETRQVTFSQRLKEGSADYRYFPEPDLPSLRLSEIAEFSPQTLRATLSELPWERRARYKKAFALKDEDIEHIVSSLERSTFFDAVARSLDADSLLVGRAVNYLVSDLTGIYAKIGTESCATLDPHAFAKLIKMVSAGELSSRGAKDTLALLVEKGGDPSTLAQEAGLLQIRDSGALDRAVAAVLASEEGAVAQYRAGKEAVLQYLLGKAMKEMRGAGDPEELRNTLLKKLAA